MMLSESWPKAPSTSTSGSVARSLVSCERKSVPPNSALSTPVISPPSAVNASSKFSRAASPPSSLV